jgi:hypothetical protein
MNGDGYEDLVTMGILTVWATHTIYYPAHDYTDTYSYSMSSSKELHVFYGMSQRVENRVYQTS